tara:strand:+ start:61 stop:621 length:561 start_codon:yes stop_codon:yes gene_type:complete
MAGIGTFIMLGIVVGSICVSMYLFLDERFIDITGESDGSVTVGDVKFYVNHIGNYEILEKNKEYAEMEKTQAGKGLATSEIAEGVYYQIEITAHNIGSETVRFTGGQFYLFDNNKIKYEAAYIGYDTSDGTEELSVVDLLPNGSITVTTQFDIPYDDEMKYSVGIIPDRFGLQDAQERGFICIQNC